MRTFSALLFVLFALSANAADGTVGTVSVQKENNLSVNGEAPLSLTLDGKDPQSCQFLSKRAPDENHVTDDDFHTMWDASTAIFPSSIWKTQLLANNAIPDKCLIMRTNNNEGDSNELLRHRLRRDYPSRGFEKIGTSLLPGLGAHQASGIPRPLRYLGEYAFNAKAGNEPHWSSPDRVEEISKYAFAFPS